MSDKGGVFKRCGCRDSATGRRLGGKCPRLVERGHGTWYFHCRVRDLWGRSEQVRRGGFPSRAAAQQVRAAVLTASQEEHAGRTWTVARWLRYWLSNRTAIRPTTLRSYTEHVQAYLIPALGQLRLAELTSRHLTAMFADLAAQTNARGQLRSPTTLQRVRATLRSGKGCSQTTRPGRWRCR